MTDPVTDPDHARTARPRHISMLLAAIIAGIGIAGLGVYGIGGAMRNASGDPTCRPAVELAKKIAPLAHGEVAALTMATAPLHIPDLTFNDGEGRPRKLSEWRGKTVLVNLWATWCVPCRKEMPALDELQGKLGGSKFEVVAINIDTRDPERPRNFLKDANLTRLGFFTDATAKVFQELKNVGRALGMPTSVLIDGAGCEIATIAGPAEWASDDAVTLVKAASGQ